MSKLVAYNELFIGKPELNRMIKFLDELGFRKIISEMSQNFGVIKNNRGNFTSLEIYNSSAGKIGIRAGSAIDIDGNLIIIKEDIDDVMTLPDTATYNHLFIEYATTHIEDLKINILGSFIYGNVGEKFTEKFVAGSLIEIVNSSLGNNGVYEILSVNTDTEIEIDTTLVDENDVNFIVQGRFTPSVVIPEDDKRPFILDTFLLTLDFDTEDPNDSKFLLARVMRSGSSVTIEDKRAENIHLFKEPYVRVFDGAFTTASSFKVGADEAGNGGRFVLLESDIPEDLLNVRIADIYGNTLTNLESGYADGELIASSVQQGIPTSVLNVRIKWGWDYITGIGGINSFTINNSAGEEYLGRLPDLSGIISSGVFTNDILAGYRLWIPQVSKFLKITGNVGNDLTVTEEDGSSVNLTGVTVTNVNPAWITVNADRYSVIAIPYTSGGINPIYTERIEQQVLFSNSPVMIEKVLQLEVAKRYTIKVRAHLVDKYTDFFDVEAGYFYKYGIQQNYSKPTLIIHPQISSVNASIGAVATSNGFRITINGWSLSQNFEICYTTDNAGASFQNPDHPKLITTNRVIDITTSESAGYNIKVRPLISGQQVATPLSVDVVSGSAGVPPNSVVLVNQQINLRTFSGTINFDGADTGTLSAIKTPAGGTLDVTSLPTDNVGKIMTIDGQNYMIVYMFSGTSVFIQPYTNDDGSLSTLPSAGNHNFTISTSKRGRRIISNILPQDFDIIRIEVDANYLPNDEVTLRVYQSSKENLADHLLIEDNDTPYGVYSDVQILGSYGQRILIVDLWDPEDFPTIGDPQKNTGGLTATVVVYGLPRRSGIVPIFTEQ